MAALDRPFGGLPEAVAATNSPAHGRTVAAGGVAPESYEIGRHCPLTARQHQVEAVVNKMIKMYCQGESFRLQRATSLADPLLAANPSLGYG